MHRGPTLAKLALVALVAGALGGCAGTDRGLEAAPRVPRQPQAQPVQFAHDVRFGPGDVRLAAAERDKLDDFLVRIRLASGDHVRVAAAGAGEAATPATLRMAERRRETVAAYLALRRATVALPRGDEVGPAPDAGVVRVVVERYLVTLPACPDWTDRPGRTFDNQAGGNWGCATAINFGLMVTEPRDLVAGRKGTPLDGEYAVMAIERYHQGKTKPLATDSMGVIESQQGQQNVGKAAE